MIKLEFQLTQLETARLVRRVGDEEAMYMCRHTLTQDSTYQSLSLNIPPIPSAQEGE